jgi:hypothetical protein
MSISLIECLSILMVDVVTEGFSAASRLFRRFHPEIIEDCHRPMRILILFRQIHLIYGCVDQTVVWVINFNFFDSGHYEARSRQKKNFFF